MTYKNDKLSPLKKELQTIFSKKNEKELKKKAKMNGECINLGVRVDKNNTFNCRYEKNYKTQKKRVLDNLRYYQRCCLMDELRVDLHNEHIVNTKDLLKYLFEIILKRKNKIITLEDFIERFPDTVIKNKERTIPSNHLVFESLCKFLIFYKYDFGTSKSLILNMSSNRELYKNLEYFDYKNKSIISTEQLLNENIVEGGKSGIADIFFSQLHNKELKFFGVSCKYFSNEKSDSKKYDVFELSEYMRKQLNNNYEVIIFVKDGEKLKNKLERKKRTNKELLTNIYGLLEINEWFQNLIKDIKKTLKENKSFEKFIEIEEKNTSSQQIDLKFHQELFVESSLYKIQKGYKKIIWGAVPRSGKSFIIGGLISHRRSENILIILGAKSETFPQFKELFTKYDDFSEYSIKEADGEIKTTKNKLSDSNKTIYIFSQELIKKGNDSKIAKQLLNEIKGKKLDLYFDEIHRGGSTDKTYQEIISKIQNIGCTFDLFIMVTATYAKPKIMYDSIIDSKEPIVLKWTYEDVMYMKREFPDNESDLSYTFGENIYNKVREKYEYEYGEKWIDMIKKQYENHPELVLIDPVSAPTLNGLMDKIDFKHSIHCDAITPSKEKDFFDIQKIFASNFDISQCMNFICKMDEEVLSPNCLFGFLQYQCLYDLTKAHCQLWFLPIKDIISKELVNGESCRDIFKKRNIKTNENELELEIDDDSVSNTHESVVLPMIEPLCRGIALSIMNNKFLSKNFCVLIIHGSKTHYFSSRKKNPDYSNITPKVCIYTRSELSYKLDIEKYYIESRKDNKNLIILTGSALRLGISIPEADIALNFDNIKSVDSNYQTMFRVLTEDPSRNKTQGYYIDFDHDRSQRFIYEMYSIYSKPEFSNGNIRQKIENGLLRMLKIYNFNDLTFNSINSLEKTKIYEKMMEKFKIDFQSYINHMTRNKPDELFRVQLTKSREIFEIFDVLTNFIVRGQTNNSKINKQLKKKKKETRGNKYINQNNNNVDDSEDDNEDKEENINIKQSVEILSECIPRISYSLGLVANDMKCATLMDCLDNIIKEGRENQFSVNEEKNQIYELLCENNSSFSTLMSDNIYFLYDKKQETFLNFLELLRNIFQKVQTMKDCLIFGLQDEIFNNTNNMVLKNDKGLIQNMTYEDILQKINKYLPIRKKEKDENGEVFTPFNLVNDMLSKIPNSKWKDPYSTWLDPANGIGNFPMVVYKKLMNSLNKIKVTSGNKTFDLSKESERSSWIIEKMLFMVELNPRNYMISRKIFGKNANIICGDFLKLTDERFDEKFGIHKFDVIIGNPPFNKGGTGQGGANAPWYDFVKKALVLLRNNKSYLCFVHPPSWRKPESENTKNKGFYELMTRENCIIYLEIHSLDDGKVFFDSGTRYDWYILRKGFCSENLTEIKDEFGNISKLNLQDWDFLPNSNYQKIKRLLKKSDEEGVPVIYSRTNYGSDKKWTQEEKTKEFKYPLIHSTPKNGPRYYYSNKIEDHNTMFGIPKVIFGDSGISDVIIDTTGKYGLTNHAIGIKVKDIEEATILKKKLESNFFNEILNSLCYSQYMIDWRIFTYFRKDFYKFIENNKKSSKTFKNTKIKGFLKTKKTKKNIGGKFWHMGKKH